MGRWAGARAWLVDGHSPYDPQVSQATQTMVYGRPSAPKQGEDPLYFAYPLTAMVFFAPFGLLPYAAARAVWMTLLEMLLPALALIGVRLAGWRTPAGVMALVMVFAILWYHGFRAIVFGQFAVVAAVLIAGALLAVQQGHDLWAGILLALAMTKPQLAVPVTLFVLLWALVARRWLLLTSILLAQAALLAGSLALMPDWPLQWLRQLVDLRLYGIAKPAVWTLTAVAPRARTWVALGVAAVLVLYLLWEWSRALGKDARAFVWTTWMTLTVTTLIAVPGSTGNDVILLPALCGLCAVWVQRWARGGAALALGMILLLGFGPWLAFLLAPSGGTEGPVLILTAPVVTLVGLWWSRWWWLRSVRLPELERLGQR